VIVAISLARRGVDVMVLKVGLRIDQPLLLSLILIAQNDNQ
jgi:hypothetical protein